MPHSRGGQSLSQTHGRVSLAAPLSPLSSDVSPNAGQVEMHEVRVALESEPAPASATVTAANHASAAASSNSSNSSALRSLPPDAEPKEPVCDISADSLARAYMRFVLNNKDKAAAPAAAAPSADGASPPVDPSYVIHYRQYAMAYSYWQPNWSSLGSSHETEDEFALYLSRAASDWSPPTSSRQGSFLKAVLFYILLVHTLPLGILFSMPFDTELSKSFTHVCQSWTVATLHRAWPASYLRAKEQRWRRIAIGVGMGVLHLAMCLNIGLRFKLDHGFRPTGSISSAVVDSWFPLTVGGLVGVIVAIQAAVTLDFRDEVQKVYSSEEKTKTAAAKKLRKAKAKMEKQRREQERKKYFSIEWDAPSDSPSSPDFFTSQLKSTNELAAASDQEARLVIMQHHPHASSWLQQPSRLVFAMSDGIKTYDNSWTSRSSILFMIISMILAITPNLIQIGQGGRWLGDCDDSDLPSNRSPCPWPLAAKQYGAIQRIVLSFVTVYFFTFLLYLNVVYFRNKTDLRTKMKSMLRRLLPDGQLEQHQNMQRAGASGAALAPPAAAAAGEIAGAAGVATVGAAGPSSAVDSSSASSSLAVLPLDLHLWWCIYRWIDQWDERERWQVQATLACYLVLVVIAFAFAMFGIALGWSGVDQQILIVTAAILVAMVSSFVLYILYRGIKINTLPIEMHKMLTDAEMELHIIKALCTREQVQQPSRSQPAPLDHLSESGLRVRTGNGSSEPVVGVLPSPSHLSSPSGSSPSPRGCFPSSSPSSSFSPLGVAAPSAAAPLVPLPPHVAQNLRVSADLLHAFALGFDAAVLSSPFTVLFVKLTPATLSAVATTAAAAAAGAVWAAVQGSIHS